MSLTKKLLVFLDILLYMLFLKNNQFKVSLMTNSSGGTVGYPSTVENTRKVP